MGGEDGERVGGERVEFGEDGAGGAKFAGGGGVAIFETPTGLVEMLVRVVIDFDERICGAVGFGEGVAEAA